MNPVPEKHLREARIKIADAVASADLDQVEREVLAEKIADAMAASALLSQNFRKDARDAFVVLASDPLVPCAGYDIPDVGHVECPRGRVIRIAMHNSDAPDGRSVAWRERAPYGAIRCVSCGSMQFNPAYRDAILARGGDEEA